MFYITNETNGKPPRLPFRIIKKSVLGEVYDLSLVFINSSVSKKLNAIYRGKKNPANVLSFPLASNDGEIFIDLTQAKKDAPNFSTTYEKFVGRLFIHAMLHLKGLQHSSKMESKELALFSKFIQ